MPDNVYRPGEVIVRARNLRELLELAGIDASSLHGKVIAHKILQNRNPTQTARILKHLEEQAVDREWKTVSPFPCRQDLPSEGVLVGRASDCVELGAPAHLPFQDLKSGHACIAGRTNSGKSIFIEWLVSCLLSPELQAVQESRVLIFDAHGEHERVVDMTPKGSVLWVMAGDLPFNPLCLLDSLSPDQASALFVDVISPVLWLGPGGSELLLHAIRHFYSDCGRMPTMPALLRVIKQQRFTANSRTKGYQEAVVRALRLIVERLAMMNAAQGITVEQLWRHNWVIDTSQLASTESQVFISLLLRASEHVRASSHRFVISEESHRLLRAGQESLGEPALVRAFRELRKRQISLVLADQTLSHLPDAVLANLCWMILFPLQNRKDVAIASSITGLTRDESEALPFIPERHAVVSSRGITPAALVRVPDVDLPLPPNKEALAQESAKVIRQYVRENQHSRQTARHPEDTRRSRSDTGREFSGVNGAGTASKAAEPREEYGTIQPKYARSRSSGVTVSIAALDYLRDLAVDVGGIMLPVTVWDKRHKVGVSKGNCLRSELLQAGLVRVETIGRTGKRGALPRVCLITRQGYQVLRERKVTARWSGKGDYEHLFWQYAIKRWLQSKHSGCNPTVECRGADVGVKIDGKEVAYEIENSLMNCVRNVIRNLGESEYDEVVVCCVEKRLLEGIRRKVCREVEIQRGQVDYRLLREFL